MTITDAQFAALEARVKSLEAQLGDPTKTIDQWRAGPNPPETAGKFYPVWKSLQQIYDSENSLTAIINALRGGAPSSPSPVVTPTPAPTPVPPSANTIPPLTTSQVAELDTALTAGVNAGVLNNPFIFKILDEAALGKYAILHQPTIDGVKLWYYGGASPVHRNVMSAYLAIVDQRAPDGSPLTIGDPRVKQVAGSVAPAPSTPPPPAGSLAAQIVAALDSLGVYIRGNGVGFGIAPDPDSQSGIHVGGRWAAEITGISNTQKSDGQNPNEIHKNSLVVADNDGGMRLRQYIVYKPNAGGPARNTTNRPQTTFAIDALGDLCVSDSRTPGQVFYLVKNGQGNVDLCVYTVGAKIRLLESVAQYGAKDKVVAP